MLGKDRPEKRKSDNVSKNLLGGRGGGGGGRGGGKGGGGISSSPEARGRGARIDAANSRLPHFTAS